MKNILGENFGVNLDEKEKNSINIFFETLEEGGIFSKINKKPECYSKLSVEEAKLFETKLKEHLEDWFNRYLVFLEKNPEEDPNKDLPAFFNLFNNEERAERVEIVNGKTEELKHKRKGKFVLTNDNTYVKMINEGGEKMDDLEKLNEKEKKQIKNLIEEYALSNIKDSTLIVNEDSEILKRALELGIDVEAEAKTRAVEKLKEEHAFKKLKSGDMVKPRVLSELGEEWKSIYNNILRVVNFESEVLEKFSTKLTQSEENELIGFALFPFPVLKKEKPSALEKLNPEEVKLYNEWIEKSLGVTDQNIPNKEEDGKMSDKNSNKEDGKMSDINLNEKTGNLEEKSIEELEKILSSIVEENKEKRETIEKNEERLRRMVLLTEIAEAQKEGKMLDKKIKDQNARMYGSTLEK